MHHCAHGGDRWRAELSEYAAGVAAGSCRSAAFAGGAGWSSGHMVLPLSAKLVVPGLLILGLELLLWVDGPCAAAPAGAGQNEGKRSVSCRGDALAVVLCGTLGPRALFGARGYFWGAEPSRRHGKGRFVYFLDIRAVIITKNRRHILAVFVELGYTITT